MKRPYWGDRPQWSGPGCLDVLAFFLFAVGLPVLVMGLLFALERLAPALGGR